MTIAARPGAITDVVVLAAVPFEGHQLYDQRLARALQRHVRVHYVEPPRPVPHKRGARRRRAFRRVDDGVQVVQPRMLPFGRRPTLAALTGAMVALQTMAALRRRTSGRTVVVACGAHPTTLRLLRRYESMALVLDDYVAGASLLGQQEDHLRRDRERIMRTVDHVAAVSPTLAHSVQEWRGGGSVYLLPPGCEVPDAGLAARRPDDASAQAVLSGMISDRLSLPMIASVAGADVRVVAAGKRQATFSKAQEWDTMVSEGLVREIGSVATEELNLLLASSHIGLLLYEDTAFNRSSFPLKLLEYMAAGLPVVSTDLPSVRWLAAPDVYIVDGDVTSAVRAAMTAARRPDTAERCRVLASKHTWDRRARECLAILTGSAPAFLP